MISKTISISWLLLLFIHCLFSQNKQIPQITLVNSIHYKDTSFTDLPGNGFLIDIGDEILAVTCKHALWENRQKDMRTISFAGKLKEWRMLLKNDTSQYIILGDLINENSSENIGERNTGEDYLVFKIKENHSKIKPLKICSKYSEACDTLYKVGWSFRTKNSEPESSVLLTTIYSGSSLLVTSLVQKNDAGSSGSPVINQNGQLVAIVSSWKYDLETKKYYEALCSVDYLWEVLYSYWMKKNNQFKSIASFKEFLKYYETLNGTKPEISSFIYIKIFFDDWIKSKNLKYGVLEDFNQWAEFIYKNEGIKIIADNYGKSLLIFNKWLKNYIVGKMELNHLEPMLKKENVFLPDFIELCERAMELCASGKYDKAINLILFAEKKIPNMGQVSTFLGDAYRAKGDKKSAKEVYLKCLKSYPGYPFALDGLSKLSY